MSNDPERCKCERMRLPDIDRLTVTDGYREVIARVNGTKHPVDVCSALTKVQVVTSGLVNEVEITI